MIEQATKLAPPIFILVTTIGNDLQANGRIIAFEMMHYRQEITGVDGITIVTAERDPSHIAQHVPIEVCAEEIQSQLILHQTIGQFSPRASRAFERADAADLEVPVP